MRPGMPAQTMLGGNGLETMLVPRFCRGRLVGFVGRSDHRAAMRMLSRVDRAVERMDRAGKAALSYEEWIDDLARSFGPEADKADRLRL